MEINIYFSDICSDIWSSTSSNIGIIKKCRYWNITLQIEYLNISIFELHRDHHHHHHYDDHHQEEPHLGELALELLVPLALCSLLALETCRQMEKDLNGQPTCGRGCQHI